MFTRRGFLAAAGVTLAADPLQLADEKGEKISVTHGRTLVLQYRYSAVRPKTYLHPLCLPDGRPITLDSPDDHVHHRGLMVAWSEVNGIDFWGETNPARHGQIVHQRFERLRTAPAAEIVALNHWVAEGKLLLTERRTLRVLPPSPEGVWLDWITELEAATHPVALAAGKHVYNGLGIRFAREMDGGGVLNSNGTASVEKANGEPAAWCAYFHAGAGVAFFDHPGNPRHPNAFFVMNKPFGYLSAAPTFREPFHLAAKQRIRFHWGVLAFPGAARRQSLQQRMEAWSKENR